MINEKVTNEELELFIKEPVNGVMVMPNMHMAKSMAKELLELRNQVSNLRSERDALREENVGKGSNTRNAADIYFQLVEEYNVSPSQGLVQFINNLIELLGDYHDMKVNEVEDYKLTYKGYVDIEGSRWFHQLNDLEEELKQIKHYLGK